MATTDEFGCAHCFQTTPEAAWQARLPLVAELLDESHFTVRIQECPHCGQRFVSIFTEMIDWSAGDDAQYWSVLPLTRDESEILLAQGEGVDVKLIESFGRGRRYLQRDYPTGKPERLQWHADLWIGPHD